MFKILCFYYECDLEIVYQVQGTVHWKRLAFRSDPNISRRHLVLILTCFLTYILRGSTKTSPSNFPCRTFEFLQLNTLLSNVTYCGMLEDNKFKFVEYHAIIKRLFTYRSLFTNDLFLY